MSVCIKHVWSSHGEPCPQCDIEACEREGWSMPDAVNVDTTLIGISPAEYNRLKICEAENQRLRNRRNEIDDEAFNYSEQVAELEAKCDRLQKELHQPVVLSEWQALIAERDRLARLLDEAGRILENSTGNDRRTDYLRHELLEALAGEGE